MVSIYSTPTNLCGCIRINTKILPWKDLFLKKNKLCFGVINIATKSKKEILDVPLLGSFRINDI